MFIICNGCNDFKWSQWLWGEILLIRPERIYGQSTNLMDLYLRVRGMEYIWKKSTSTCNLLTYYFSFILSSINSVFWHLTPYKVWKMFKVNNKNTRTRKINNKVNNKGIVHVVLVSLLLNLNIFCFLLQCFHRWLW